MSWRVAPIAFWGASAAADLGVMRSEVGALGADCGLGQRNSQPHRAVSGALSTALSAKRLLPGQIPTHEPDARRSQR
jgi:hypothetical protein